MKNIQLWEVHALNVDVFLHKALLDSFPHYGRCGENFLKSMNEIPGEINE